MTIKQINLNRISGNRGQIQGLPRNPRQWTADDLDRLIRSIEETPELAEARPIIVYPNGGKYVVLGGNLRLEAFRRMKAKEVMCAVLDEGMTTEKLREIVLKDNSSFGEWDADELANNWDTEDLEAWGVDVAALGGGLSYEGSNIEIDTSNFSEDMSMRFSLTAEEYEFIHNKLKDGDPKQTILKMLGYYGQQN